MFSFADCLLGMAELGLHAQLGLPSLTPDHFWPGTAAAAAALGFPPAMFGLGSLGIPWPPTAAAAAAHAAVHHVAGKSGTPSHPPPQPSIQALLSQYVLTSGLQLPMQLPMHSGYAVPSPQALSLTNGPSPCGSPAASPVESQRSPTGTPTGPASPRRASIEALRLRAQEHQSLAPQPVHAKS